MAGKTCDDRVILKLLQDFPTYKKKQKHLQDNPAFIIVSIYLLVPPSTLFGVAVLILTLISKLNMDFQLQLTAFTVRILLTIWKHSQLFLIRKRRYVNQNTTMEPVTNSQRKNNSKQIEHSIIALKQQLLGVILCFFLNLRWPWLLRFFGKMLQTPFKFKIIEI